MNFASDTSVARFITLIIDTMSMPNGGSFVSPRRAAPAQDAQGFTEGAGERNDGRAASPDTAGTQGQQVPSSSDNSAGGRSGFRRERSPSAAEVGQPAAQRPREGESPATQPLDNASNGPRAADSDDDDVRENGQLPLDLAAQIAAGVRPLHCL